MDTEIFVTTPCLNAASTIDQTIQSVVGQAGPFRLRYHIQDGGSTDGTWERILWWQTQIARADWPLACRSLSFSCHQAPDAGMYDAVCTGIAALAPPDPAFVTWLNADDVLLPGSAALVVAAGRQFSSDQLSWLGGAAAVMRDDRIVATHDRALPTEVIRRGLCDAAHWQYVQQEGLFFRGWLWRAIDPEATIRPLRLAGDWNLWRHMAQHAALVQSMRPLAVFRQRPGQMSEQLGDAYQAEIEACVPTADRTAAFTDQLAGPALTRQRLHAPFASDRLSIWEDPVDGRRFSPRTEAFDAQALEPAASKMLHEGHLPEETPEHAEPARPQTGTTKLSPPAKARLTHLKTGDWFTALDHGWQYPAITEEQAFRQLQRYGGLPSNLHYIAYPWASLIDHLQADGREKESQSEVFSAFCAALPDDGRPRITTCQHILLPRFLPLLKQAGIDHVFWPHRTKTAPDPEGLSLHPFPLYPVQRAEPRPPEDRTWLFSFIGARADEHYPQKTRNWILDRLAEVPDGMVRGREAWHFAHTVYHQQIWQTGPDAGAAAADDAASAEFRDALTRSTFILCPSGSGPNSIRLWEAIGARAIPVLLSDDLALPGDPDLWAKAVVTCEETPEAVAALPDRLRRIAKTPGQLEAMRRAAALIWQVYGPDGFIPDILTCAETLACTARAPSASAGATAELIAKIEGAPLPDPSDAELLLTLAAGEALTGQTAEPWPPQTQRALARARAALGARHAAVKHFDACTEAASRAKTRNTESFAANIDSDLPGLPPILATMQALAPAQVDISNRPPAGTDKPPLSGAALTEAVPELEHTYAEAIATSLYPEPLIRAADRARKLRPCFFPNPGLTSVQRVLDTWAMGTVAEYHTAHRQTAPLQRIGTLRLLWTLDPAAAADLALEAFAIGAFPALPLAAAPFASAFVPEGACLDLSGLSAVTAARRVQTFAPTAQDAALWLSARSELSRAVFDLGGLMAERKRIGQIMARRLRGLQAS